MKKLLYVSLLVAVVSCGKVSPKGNIENKEVPVENFKNIFLKGKFVYFMPEEKKIWSALKPILMYMIIWILK